MKIGLIDVDGHNFSNLPLMKLSAWHKQQGDSVEWYEPLFSGHLDKVYMSKVFSFTPDYEYYINADVIEKGGSGYCISVIDGKEVFDKSKDKQLPYEIEHIYPDYELYGIKDTAYGFLSRGCPRGCDFCHVAAKEGRKSYKVADLNEFWRGQKNIVLNDPNITACPDCLELFDQLIESKAHIDFNQGLDIRFAWDRYKDKNVVLPKFKMFKEIYGGSRSNVQVYILSNFDSTFEQDLERIYTIRDLGYSPYLTIYNKESLPKWHTLRKIQRWCNNRWVFNSCKRFEDYKA